MHLAQKSTQLRCYEYIAEFQSTIIDIFKTKHDLKVKGDGKLSYHLGAAYFQDPDGTLLANLGSTLISKLKLTKYFSMMNHQEAIRPLWTKMITQN